MDYTEEYFEDVVTRFGEVFFVLESGEEYEVHGSESFEFVEAPNPSSVSRDYTLVRVEGLRDGEYAVVEFPLDTVEHHRTHREV